MVGVSTYNDTNSSCLRLHGVLCEVETSLTFESTKVQWRRDGRRGTVEEGERDGEEEKREEGGREGGEERERRGGGREKEG